MKTTTNRLLALVESWKRRARWTFADAGHERNEMGKRLIEHGAMCYYNAATELADLISKPPPASGSRAKSKTSTKRKA
jgi:hypothetical protein